MLAQLKRVMHHHNPTKCIGHVALDQRIKARVHGNYPCISKKMTTVETALKRDAQQVLGGVTMMDQAFISWLESHPTIPDFQRSQKRSSRIWRVLLRDTFIHISQQILLYWGRNWTALNFSHDKPPSSDLKHSNLLPRQRHSAFDNGTSGIFRHENIHLQIVGSHDHSIGHVICMTIGSVFEANVIPHDWEVLAQYFCKKSEHL